MCSSGPQSDVRDTAWRTLVMSILHLPRFLWMDLNPQTWMNTEYLFWKDFIGVHCVSGSGSYTHLFIQHTLFTSEVFGIKVMKGCLLSKLEKIPVV